MSIFKTERSNDIQERHDKLAEIRRQRKLNRRIFLDNQKIQYDSKAIQESVETIDNNSKKPISVLQEKRNEKLAESRWQVSHSMLESRLFIEGFKKCYDVAIFEMVYDGCWIDDNVKEKTVQEMFDVYHDVQETLDSVGIEKVSPAEESKFIKNLKEIITESAKKTAKRQSDDAKDSAKSKDEIKSISFEMSGEEANKLDKDLSELGPDEIAELVKSKVLTVIQDEKESGRQKEKIFNEIDEISKEEEEATKASEDILNSAPETKDSKDDTSTETPSKESADVHDEGYTSLLDAMLEATSLDISEEIEEFEKESSVTESEQMTEEKPNRSVLMANMVKRTNKYIGTSLFECIMTNSLENVKEHVAIENVEVENNNDIMDAAFMESVMVYTVLETFNTLGLYKFDNTSTRKLANYYMTRNK